MGLPCNLKALCSPRPSTPSGRQSTVALSPLGKHAPLCDRRPHGQGERIVDTGEHSILPSRRLSPCALLSSTEVGWPEAGTYMALQSRHPANGVLHVLHG